MSSRSFRSVFMVASCAGAALGCYLVSLRVASERAQLENVETKIVLAQRDMRVLQTEIGTRGRLSQLERWNAGAFALSAPAADQLLKGNFELARLEAPEHQPDFKAPVVLASAPAPEKKAPLAEPATDDSGEPAVAAEPRSLLHVASLKVEPRDIPAPATASVLRHPTSIAEKAPHGAKTTRQPQVPEMRLAAAHRTAGAETQRRLKVPVLIAKSSHTKPVDKAPVVTGQKLTKAVHLAKVDPLAPLPDQHSGHSKGIAAER